MRLSNIVLIKSYAFKNKLISPLGRVQANADVMQMQSHLTNRN